MAKSEALSSSKLPLPRPLQKNWGSVIFLDSTVVFLIFKRPHWDEKLWRQKSFEFLLAESDVIDEKRELRKLHNLGKVKRTYYAWQKFDFVKGYTTI